MVWWGGTLLVGALVGPGGWIKLDWGGAEREERGKGGVLIIVNRGMETVNDWGGGGRGATEFKCRCISSI